jgi:hypothetical protein
MNEIANSRFFFQIREERKPCLLVNNAFIYNGVSQRSQPRYKRITEAIGVGYNNVSCAEFNEELMDHFQWGI